MFSPGEYHGQKSLVGYSPRGHTESDTTEQLTHTHPHTLIPFPVVQLVKNLLAMQETWVLHLDREDPLEQEMTTHSSTLAWGIQ